MEPGLRNKRQVTGLAYLANGAAHAFLWTAGSMKDLGTLGSTSWGFGINDSGLVVGQSSFGNTYHAFVFSGGKMRDLNKLIPPGSGWTLVAAHSINNTGQIVGEGVHNGQQHGFLLTPR
jgi:probable HAF family extracellular repeat protein